MHGVSVRIIVEWHIIFGAIAYATVAAYYGSIDPTHFTDVASANATLVANTNDTIIASAIRSGNAALQYLSGFAAKFEF